MVIILVSQDLGKAAGESGGDEHDMEEDETAETLNAEGKRTRGGSYPAEKRHAMSMAFLALVALAKCG